MARTRRALKKAASKKRQLVLESRFSWVVRNQKGLCWYCNTWMGLDATKEHLLAQARGGTDYFPHGNLKAAHSACNQAVGHLSVDQKFLLRSICRDKGLREMFITARKMVRAQIREAFQNPDLKPKGMKNGKRDRTPVLC